MINKSNCVDIKSNKIKSVKSILTNLFNNELDGDFDGICFIKKNNSDKEYLFLNHEIDDTSSKINNAKVTRITYKNSKCIKNEYWLTNLKSLCSMFRTPWNTVLTNDEDDGYVYEFDPYDKNICLQHKKLGKMNHEKTIFAPCKKKYKYDFYTTSDNKNGGGIYKFTPDKYKNLSKGKLYGFSSLEGKSGDKIIKGEWKFIDDPENATKTEGIVQFIKIEGLTYNNYDGHIYFCVTSDLNDGLGYIYKLNLETPVAELYLDCNKLNGKLGNPDNIASDKNGNLYICEGKKDKSIPDRLIFVQLKTKKIETLLQGRDNYGEMTGVEFNNDYSTLFVNWKNGKLNNNDDDKKYSELFEVKF